MENRAPPAHRNIALTHILRWGENRPDIRRFALELLDEDSHRARNPDEDEFGTSESASEFGRLREAGCPAAWIKPPGFSWLGVFV